MNKNGCLKDIRLKLSISGDLLTPLDIALLQITLKILRGIRSPRMSPQSMERNNTALSGRRCNLPTGGTL
jgi:hypothetical protein